MPIWYQFDNWYVGIKFLFQNSGQTQYIKFYYKKYVFNFKIEVLTWRNHVVKKEIMFQDSGGNWTHGPMIQLCQCSTTEPLEPHEREYYKALSHVIFQLWNLEQKVMNWN